MHPMLRIAARFPEAFNDPGWGVPVQQIDQFKPEVTLGCSHSSLPHIALWLQGDGVDKKAYWPNGRGWPCSMWPLWARVEDGFDTFHWSTNP